MSETVVFRDVIGEQSGRHDVWYDLDLEITRKEGRETRSRTRDRLNKNIYHLVLVFTSHVDNDVLRHICTADDLKFLCTINVDALLMNDNFVSHFGSTLYCRNKHGNVFRESALFSDGHLRIIQAIRVKEFLDNYEQFQLTIPIVAKKYARDIQYACAERVMRSYASKGANHPVDTVAKFRAEVARMKEPEVQRQMKIDMIALFSKCSEVLGLRSAQPHSFYDLMMNKVDHYLNRYVNHCALWTAEMLLASNIWELMLGR